MLEGLPLPEPSLEGVLVFIVVFLLSILGLCMRAIIKGDLVPRSSHEETVEREKEWKSLAFTNQETIHGQNETLGVQAGTISKQAETGEAFTHLFDAIKAQAEANR